MTSAPVVRGFVLLALFGSWPFVAFLAHNQGLGFQHQDVYIAWAATLAALTLLAIIITAIFDGVTFERAAVLSGVLGTIFFSFGGVSRLLAAVGVTLGTVRLLVWGAVFLLGGWLVWKASRNRALRLGILAAAAVMVALPLAELAYASVLAGVRESRFTEQNSMSAPDIGSSDAGARNVYWFLLDGYVRDDSLKTYFDYDNAPFLDALSERGFLVARSAYSNYDNTTSSLSSTLSAEYVQLPGQRLPDRRTLTGLLSGRSPVVRRFKSLGYHYIHAPYAGSSKTQCNGIESLCIRAKRTDATPLSDVQVSLLRMTPVYRVVSKLFQGVFVYDHVFVEDIERQIPYSFDKSYFLFAHILSPHAPPRYTPRCERLADVAPTIDVSDNFYDPVQFRTDTRCLNMSVIRALDLILEKDKTDPIIIMQGDHGFQFRLPGEEDREWDINTDRSLQVRRMAILNAQRLPPDCRKHFYDGISPINTFRLTFACLENRKPDLLADRHFFRANKDDANELGELRD